MEGGGEVTAGFTGKNFPFGTKNQKNRLEVMTDD